MVVFECLNQIIIHVKDTQTHPFIVKDSLIYFISEQNYRQKEICSSRIKKKETIYKSINGYQFVIEEKPSLETITVTVLQEQAFSYLWIYPSKRVDKMFLCEQLNGSRDSNTHLQFPARFRS